MKDLTVKIMEKTIKQAVENVKTAFGGYTLTDRAYMFDTAAGLLLEEMVECLEREYNLKEFFGETE